ncbi:MAG: hypothetical protein ISS15_06315 [Alphaproteobacteria bacterium]|nr:hypothetical protein [Alphaproteobacteria bacterium]MBL6938197.1 hypothetical protein [Alphaproteobacteria bacterium]MBL7097253.1 hypothetical protein [Alphaproteobacteria bacterium]
MKNSELLTTRPQDLDHAEKRRRYVLRCLVQNNPCPHCGQLLNFFEGANIAIDDWQSEPARTPCRCRACGDALQYVVPRRNGGWHWELPDPQK